jgi:hypothetical protein
MRRQSNIERALQLPGGRWLVGLIALVSLAACQAPAGPIATTPQATLAAGLITPPPTSPVTRESQPDLPQAIAHPTTIPVDAATLPPPMPTANPQAPFGLSASPVVPERLRAELQHFAASNGDLFRWVEEGGAEVRLEVRIPVK